MSTPYWGTPCVRARTAPQTALRTARELRREHRQLTPSRPLPHTRSTSSEDWCEPNYAVTPYIAEFWNTLSSVPIILFALTALYIGVSQGFRKRFLVPTACTALVGVGSIVFHASLQYWGQAMDELFMVYAATAYMCMIAFSDRTIPARFIVPAALTLDAAFTGAYVYLRSGPFFIFFVVIFGVLSTWLCYASLQMHRRTFSPILQRLFWAGQLTWLGGFGIFWFPDKLACEYVQRFHLHAFFHLCVATAPLLFLTHAVHCFYSAELAVVTGKVSDSTGKLIPAPPEVMRYISEREMREHIAVDVAPKTIAVPELYWSWIPVPVRALCALPSPLMTSPLTPPTPRSVQFVTFGHKSIE